MENEVPPVSTARGLALRALLSLIFLGWVGWAAFQSSQEFTDPLGPDAPEGEFSAGRALKDLRWIAAQPRTIGSEAHAQVRERLVGILEAAGLEVDLQKATAVRPSAWGGPARVASLENIVARRPGGGQQPALLLMAHYDSVPYSPGAGDDGSGVAAILEVLRALGTEESLDHELLILISDGEEAGLLGAQVFVDQHPWAERVGVALNLEARGSSGPALMFRTGAANGWLTRLLGRAVKAPRASSLGYEVFRFLPNDTDLSVFTGAGLEGMDFAFIGDYPRYHSARDSVENLDPASLQHMGEQALGLLRALDRESLAELPVGQAVYFNLYGNQLVVYPAAWALPLALALIAMWLSLAVLTVRRGLTRPSADLRAAGGVLLAAALAGGVSLLAWQQAAHLDPDFGGLPLALSYKASTYQGAFVLLALAAAGFVLLPMVRAAGAGSVVLGTTFLTSLLALVTAVLVPGASYIFLWPTFAGLLSLAALVALGVREEEGEAQKPWWSWGLGGLAALPVLLLWVPLVYLLLGALGLPLAWAAMPLVALGVGLCAHLWAPVAQRGAFWIPALCLVASLILLVIAVRKPSFDAQHPRGDSLIYCVDPGGDLARWGSPDPKPSPWMEPVLGTDPVKSRLEWCLPRSGRRGFLIAEAPVLSLETPQIDLIHRQDQGDGTFKIAVRIRSRRPSQRLAVGVESLAAVQAFSVNGERQDLGDSPVGGNGEAAWLFLFLGDARQGLTLEVELNQTQAVEFLVVDGTYGLPAEAPARPIETMPRPFRWDSDMTMVKASRFF